MATVMIGGVEVVPACPVCNSDYIRSIEIQLSLGEVNAWQDDNWPHVDDMADYTTEWDSAITVGVECRSCYIFAPLDKWREPLILFGYVDADSPRAEDFIPVAPTSSEDVADW